MPRVDPGKDNKHMQLYTLLNMLMRVGKYRLTGEKSQFYTAQESSGGSKDSKNQFKLLLQLQLDKE